MKKSVSKKAEKVIKEGLVEMVQGSSLRSDNDRGMDDAEAGFENATTLDG
jgi:hypothetical protein